jgi:elongation factor P--(R)-beta-lysine ligase
MQLREALELRAAVIATVRAFFAARGYLEVDTPVLVPSPGLDLHLDAFEVAGGAGYLVTSPEYQMKRLLGEGLERIVQIGHCFRRGERGERHNPEFTMVEWYRAGAGWRELVDETEALVRAVAEAHRGGKLFALAGGAARDIDVGGPFARLTVVEAFERFAGVGRDEVLRIAQGDEERYFRLLIERVEPGIAALGAPVFLCDYPASQASLARKKPEDPDLCERFELYLGDVELCNGFGELTDPAEQRARFVEDRRRRAAQGLPVYPIDEQFLAAVARMRACAGNALGLDRLIAAAAGTAAIADVMAFPAERL